MRDRPGQLFAKDAPSQRVANGDAINLNGSQWQACMERDCLVLSEVIRTDDKKDQTTSRIANIKREMEGRQQELEALAVDFARVVDEAKTVPSCCFCFVFVCCCVSHHLLHVLVSLSCA